MIGELVQKKSAVFNSLMTEHLIDPFHGLLIQLPESLSFSFLTLGDLDSGTMIMIDKIGGSLNPGIGELANLLRVEPIPSPATELLIEVKNELSVDKVHKGIAYITGIVRIDRKVDAVNTHFVISTQLIIKHLL